MPASDNGSTKLTPLEAMEILGIESISDLVNRTGLGIDSVRRAVMGGAIRTNETTADRIAEILELKTDDILWPSGLTNVGRPALTGHPKRKSVEVANFCPEHHLLRSLSGECSLCAA